MLQYFLAFAPPGGSGQQGPGGFTIMLPWLAILAVVYLLILRPQSKKQKQHQQMLDNITKGDKVVTTGGLHGEVQRVDEKAGTLIIRVSDGMKLTLERGAIARKIVPDNEK